MKSGYRARYSRVGAHVKELQARREWLNRPGANKAYMKNEERMYTIDTGYANAGVIVRGNRITEAAPIFKWMVGEAWSRVRYWPKIKSIYCHTEKRTIYDAQANRNGT